MMAWQEVDMAWIDSRVWCHPKTVSVSDRAFRVWVNGIAYASGFETYGKLNEQQQRIIGSTPKVRQELVDAGLWDRDNGVVMIHDWDDHNGQRDARAEARREKDRLRKQAARSAAKSKGSPRGRPADTPRDVYTLTDDRVTVEGRSFTAVGDHGVSKLLSVLSDRDDGTEGVIRSFVLKGASEADLAWAHECATGPGVESPTRVAVAELRKRLKAKEAA